MADDRDIRLTALPAEPLAMRHGFDDAQTLPVRLGFAGEAPLGVRLGSGGQPFPVDMRMLVSARRAIPLCLSLCEAICAESDYTIGITLFDRPIITIRLRGRTRLFSED